MFVPFTAPGDRVLVNVTEDRRRFRRGRVTELLEPGPGRVDPVCDVFGTCGGCAWQHVDYPEQLDAKRQILRDALTRIGGVRWEKELPFTASPDPYHYRGRARLLSRESKVGYRRLHSHALCAVRRCPLLVPELDGKLGELAASLEVGEGAGGTARREGDSEWELVAGSAGALARRLGDAGEPASTVEVGGDALRVSAGVFLQANRLLWESLVAAVLGAAGRGATAWDLYAGAGFFTLGLARRFEEVVAVESNPAAVADLRANRVAAGCDSVQVVEARLEDALGAGLLGGSVPDVVILDPPRTGLAGGVAEQLAELGVPRIVYLSCDPATLARDIATFADASYSVTSVRGFDLFPQTSHVEALVVLER